MTPEQIIKRPLILTEKGNAPARAGEPVPVRGRRTANKTQIRNAVETLFKVKVEQGAHADRARPHAAHGPRPRARPRTGRRRSCRSRTATRSTSSREPEHADQTLQADLARRAATTKSLTGEGLTKKEPERKLARVEELERRPQPPRAHHLALPGRRPQAALPPHRLQAQQDRRARDGRVDRVRSEPQRAHRAPALQGRREALHPRARRPRGRRPRCVARAPPTSSPATRCRCGTSRPAR